MVNNFRYISKQVKSSGSLPKSNLFIAADFLDDFILSTLQDTLEVLIRHRYFHLKEWVKIS